MPSFTDTLTVNGENMEMYASLPTGPGPHPAVVIAFHVGGVDEFDKVMADRLAEEGYVAVVPDLFHRLSQEQMDGPRLDRLITSACVWVNRKFRDLDGGANTRTGNPSNSR